MKTFLLGIGASIVFFGCGDPTPASNLKKDTVYIYRNIDINTKKDTAFCAKNKYNLVLNKHERFYFGYVDYDIDTFTIVDFVKDGVLAKDHVGLLTYIPFHDLYYSHNFKVIGR